MTFPTNQKNTFKKSPVRGLEYNHTEYRPFPVVQVAALILVMMIIVVGFRMCTTEKVAVTVEQLNSRTHD